MVSRPTNISNHPSIITILEQSYYKHLQASARQRNQLVAYLVLSSSSKHSSAVVLFTCSLLLAISCLSRPTDIRRSPRSHLHASQHSLKHTQHGQLESTDLNVSFDSTYAWLSARIGSHTFPTSPSNRSHTPSSGLYIVCNTVLNKTTP